MRRVADLWRHDLLGVRLGVLAIVLPVVALNIAYTLATRGHWLHPPDSRYYLSMTSRDLGHGVSEAIARTRDVGSWRVAPWYFAGDEPTWQIVKTRGLYPVLSIPFVLVFGLKAGTLFVPCLSVVAFCWVTARVLQRLYGPPVAALVVVAFGLTTTAAGLIWATTDALAMALAAVLVANLPIERRVGRANLVWLGAACVGIALTRQVGILAPALGGVGWAWATMRERRVRNPWLGAMLVTVVVAGGTQMILSAVAHVDTQGILARGQTTFGGVVRQFLRNVGTVTRGDHRYMWSSDRLLYVLLGTAVLMTLLRITKDFAAVFLGALASTYVLTAGIGYSAGMRYEVVMFPAAAVATGAFAAWALNQQGSPFPVVREPGFDHPTGLWIPQLVGAVAVLGLCVGVTALGGSRSTVPAPASPSYNAAQGGQPYAVTPLATPSAAVTLKAAFNQALKTINGNAAMLEGPFDWVHALRYRPTDSADPNWDRRSADGTTITRVNAMTDAEAVAFANTITFDGLVRPDTVLVGRRRASPFGEDVSFTVLDADGRTHSGTATTLYPIWSADDPGVVTALVYAQ